MYDFSSLTNSIEEIIQWLAKEYTGIRTGRATPALLDGIMVESYGTRVPLHQVANIGIEDPRTLRVTPFDNSQVKEIEKAITDADLGVGISVDAAGLRVTFPELTAERRTVLIKLAKDKREEARVSLRKARDETWNDIQARAREGEISEDEKFSAKERMEDLVKKAQEDLDALFEKKEKEIQE